MRELRWDGCVNVRDLGGVPLRGGGATVRAAVARGDAPDRLTSAGWAALRAHGVRTIVDLRNGSERGAAARRDGVEVVHIPLDGLEHRDFWDRWEDDPGWASPLYYRPFLQRFPDRAAAAVRAVASAPPGGVLVHCVGGRDRAGLVSLLLLALAGAEPDAIAADYEMSIGHHEDDDLVARHLAARGTSAHELVLELLASTDLDTLLRGGGLSGAEIGAARDRLIEHRRTVQGR